MTATEFGFPEVEKLAKKSLKDASTMNIIRWKLFNQLQTFDLPIECGSGGLTKFNRTKRNLPKEHFNDALCVGKSTPESFIFDDIKQEGNLYYEDKDYYKAINIYEQV